MAPRRTLDEWLLAVELGRTVRFSVVEGPSDAAVIHCLASDPFKSEVVEVDSIHVELEAPANAFLGGKKARLWELGRSLQRAALPNAICFVDRDFDELCACVPRYRPVVLSDFANLPCGFADYDFISGVLRRAHNLNLTQDQWQAFCAIFKRLFLYRYWKAANRPTKAMTDPLPSFSQAERVPRMNWDHFFGRIVAAGDCGMSAIDLREAVEQLEVTFEGDPRLTMHSDDFFDLLHRYLRLLRRIPNTASRDMTRAALLGAMATPRPDQTNLTQVSQWLNWSANTPHH
jgi:hypothetical protein